MDLIASQIKAKKGKRRREVGDYYHDPNKIRANEQERGKKCAVPGECGIRRAHLRGKRWGEPEMGAREGSAAGKPRAGMGAEGTCDKGRVVNW